jgi:hypothetical protein
MKKTSQNKIQSSVPVQHSHTNTDTAAPAAQPDNRERTGNLPPIDRDQRTENRKLDTAAVITRLRETLPTIAQRATVVGTWVWLSFDTTPAPETRQQISQLGFHWNNTRRVWQHPCGHFTFGSKADPRDTYTSKPAMEAYN